MGRRHIPTECRINLGLAGQLSEHTLGEALIGIKFAVTQSSSDWGHELAPKRFYLTAFAFVDTDSVPLIGPDVERNTVALSRTYLPDASETFFNEDIVEDKAVIGAWTADKASENRKLIQIFSGALGKHRSEVEVGLGSTTLLTRIQKELGTYLVYKDITSKAVDKLRSTIYALEATDPALQTALCSLAKEHMSLRKINTRLNELERTYDLHTRHLGDTAKYIPTGISLIIVQVDASKVKPGDIPGFIPVVAEAPKQPANVVTTPNGVEVHVQVETAGQPPKELPQNSTEPKRKTKQC